ncbi:MAG: phosphatidate cytidylyltransferase, partial [Elusimicrobia bacterium]|nr:phosphatidate cytidylyltransferase [Elusimicrobiota bacterium]
MLLPRFLTALVGVPLVLGCIWWGQIPFLMLVLGIVLLSLYEYYSLFEGAGWNVFKYVSIACGLSFSLLFLLNQSTIGKEIGLRMGTELLFPFLSLLILLLLTRALLSSDKENAFFAVAASFFGIFYIAWSLPHILLIRDLRPDGKEYTFFLFCVIWSLDIGAYLGGKILGKNRVSTYVSPKKTWEGTLIGSLAALLVALIYRSFFLKSLPLQETLILATLILITAQISDFSESLFKRNVQVKDSGSLLPGHGGLLDRFDSFLLTTPLYYYYLIWFIIP